MEQTAPHVAQKRAVAYVRTASFSPPDDGATLKEQERTCEAHAHHLGMSIVETYVDNGVSGLSNSRPGLNRMLTDLASGHIGYVITIDHERLARSQALAASLTAKIADLGARLITVKK